MRPPRRSVSPASFARAMRVAGGLLVVMLTVFCWSLVNGSDELDWHNLPGLLWAPDDSMASEILYQLRLPRALAAMSTGALLAISGALMQVLLRNPLADPYVLGLSGTASLGALSMMAVGAGAWWIEAGAFGGALLAIVAVFALARQDWGRVESVGSVDSAPRLLLTGVMFSSLAMAGVSLILSLAPGERLRGMLFWIMGDLSGAHVAGPVLCLPIFLLGVVLPFSRDLNLMLRGSGPAQMLGVNVGRIRRLIFLAASVAAATAVTNAGAIGFVGLVVPHALRLLVGNDQRVLLPASALAGASFLLLADTLARVVADPLQLPVGVITALVGAPTFIVLLRRRAAS